MKLLSSAIALFAASLSLLPLSASSPLVGPLGGSDSPALLPVNATAGEAICSHLPDLLQNHSSLKFNSTPVSWFYQDGNHDSFQAFAHSYPPEWLAEIPTLGPLVIGAGPDVNLRKDFEYGMQGTNQRAKDIANHGPLGGSPAFCR